MQRTGHTIQTNPTITDMYWITSCSLNWLSNQPLHRRDQWVVVFALKKSHRPGKYLREPWVTCLRVPMGHWWNCCGNRNRMSSWWHRILPVSVDDERGFSHRIFTTDFISLLSMCTHFSGKVQWRLYMVCAAEHKVNKLYDHQCPTWFESHPTKQLSWQWFNVDCACGRERDLLYFRFIRLMDTYQYRPNQHGH